MLTAESLGSTLAASGYGQETGTISPTIFCGELRDRRRRAGKVAGGGPRRTAPGATARRRRKPAAGAASPAGSREAGDGGPRNFRLDRWMILASEYLPDRYRHPEMAGSDCTNEGADHEQKQECGCRHGGGPLVMKTLCCQGGCEWFLNRTDCSPDLRHTRESCFREYFIDRRSSDPESRRTVRLVGPG